MPFSSTRFLDLRNPTTWSFACAVSMLITSASSAGKPELRFEKDIRPILKAQCFHCHGEDDVRSGGLDVRLVRLMREGGESGSALSAGEPEQSLLWQRIASDEMPSGNKKLSLEQKQIIRLWIEQGAKTVRAEPENVDEARFSYEELSHWAWRAVEVPAVPKIDQDVSTPIDSFIGRRLLSDNLNFSPRADQRTLIRRLTFDLLGIPPTADEIHQFIHDDSDNACEQLIDRLLASQQFGVRWGRHWLDVAGFAETNGGQAGDIERPHAWRYRDYIINSFNANKPIDQFYVEQLAGDELIEGEIDIHNARHLELLTATGFLRMAPDATQVTNTLEARNTAVAETLKVVSSSMLGVTVGCAQCHDHKYDAIGIDDYYSFRAIFDPAFPLANWQQPNSRLVDFTTDQVKVEAAKIEQRAAKLDADLKGRRDELAKQIQERKLDSVPEADRDATRQAVLTEAAKQTDDQKRLLDLHPMVKPVGHILGLLVEYDMPAYRKFEKEANEIARLRATKPAGSLVMVTTEQPEVVPVSKVFHRGNLASPKQEVSPRELAVLSRNRENVFSANDESRPTTGRRLAYARQLTDGTHPLTSRVFVNRIWHHHFGRGLVATLSDFGIAGESPSHPELLDWLADDFVRSGWDSKRLHKMILMSRTYQQVSTRNEPLDRIDPENILLGRMSVRRLEAEAIRDAVLMAAGRLDCQLGGPGVSVTENSEGKVVLGKRLKRDGINAGVDNAGAAATRRSVYVQIKRGTPLNMLATFDQPEMTPNCDLRRPTTVAMQSLWFLNDSEIIDRSRQLASKLIEAQDTDPARVEDLFVRLFAATPNTNEMKTCLKFLEAQQKHFSEKPSNDKADDTKRQTFAVLCQILFASNRFLYID